MKTVNQGPFQRWRLYRLSVIIRLEDLADARQAMRCATSDCGQYPVNEQQMPLGVPPCKCMLSFELRMQQRRAPQLLAALERALAAIPIVLLRIEVMGSHAERTQPGRLHAVRARATGVAIAAACGPSADDTGPQASAPAPVPALSG